MIRLIGGVMVFGLAMPVATALTPSYVTDPNSCPSSHSQFPGQNCSGGLNICGVDTSTPTEVTQCYDNSTISAPGGSATSNTLYTGSLGGGYILDCFAQVDSSAPYCDNNGAWLCNRSSTCYTTKQRDTTCTAPGVASCGSCRSGYQDCGGDDACEVQTGTTNYPTGANNNYAASCGVQCDSGYLDCDASGAGTGNGCEIQVGGACTTSDGATGTYSGCTCVPTKSYFQTGTRSTYSTSNPLLWGRQLNGTGQLISFANKVGEMFAVYNSGAVKIGNFTAGTGTGAGTIRWTGADFEGYDGASWISMTGGSAGGLTIVSGDARYVRKAGDTMTGSLIVQATMSGRHLIVSQTASFSGALIAAGNATVRGTLSGSRLVVSGHTNISGTLLVLNGITSRRTISGANLYAAASISGAHLYSATTFGGAGLASCNGAAQKLMYNSTTKRFECGTDLNTGGGSVSTGNVLTIGDARYVRKSGDTMTGALIVQATMSGRHLIVSQTASFSGAVIAKNNVTVKGTLSGSRLVVSGNTNISGTLLVLNTITSKSTISGSNLFASKSLTGTHLYAAQTFGGAGLADCDTAGTSKLLWDSTTKRFSCGTDQDTDTNTTYTAGQGLTLNGTSFRLSDAFSGTSLAIYGTMSGSRLVVSGHANISGSLLVKNNITTRGTLSGTNLTVSRSASISGTLIVKTGITSKGSVSGSTIDGFGLGSCNGATQKLLYNATTDKFECGTITASASPFSTGNVLTIGDARYVKKSGDTMTGSLNVRATISGSRLVVDSNANISGALLVKGNVGIGTTTPKAKLDVLGGISGTTLTLSTLRNCDTIDTDASGNLVCGSDQSAGSGLDQNTADARYVRKAGDTMTGALVIDIIGGNPSTLGLDVKNTISGSRLIVSGHANISGSLLVKNNLTTRGTLSGTNLTVSRSASISGTLIVKTGITSKGSVSGATIDGFGLGSCNGASQKLLYNATTDKFECGTITASASPFSTGNVLTIGDARYVRKSGDTMTGALVVDITGGNLNTIGLKVVNTLSGAHLHAEKTLSTSGALIVESAIGFRLYDTVNDLGITSNRGGANQISIHDNTTDVFLYDGANGNVSIATLANGNITLTPAGAGNVGIATSAPKAKLDVFGTISGSRLSISNNANISGALLVKNNITSLGTLSGYNLTVSRSASISGTLIVKTGITSKGSVSGSTIDGFGLGSCNSGTSKLLYNSTTDKFECGTISTSSTFGTGNVLTIGDARYLRRSGGTMTGQLVVDITGGNFNTVGLKVINTLSGAHLHAERTLSSSGTAIVKGNITTQTGSLWQPVYQTDDGLVGYWSFSETGSSVAYDRSPYGNDGTLTNGAAFLAGKYGTAMRFDGINDYVDIGTSSSLSMPSGPVTVSAWFYSPSPTANQTIVGNAHGAANYGITYGFTDNKIDFWNNGSGPSVTSSGSITDGAWHHVAATRTGTTGNWVIKLYIDGVLDKTQVTGQDPSAGSSTQTAIGRFGSFNGYYFNGGIDEVRIFNRALTEEEIRTQYLGVDSNTAIIANKFRILNTSNTLLLNMNDADRTLEFVGTLSGSRLSVSGNANITGSVLAVGNITTRATLSGSRLIVSGHANISGALLVRNNITTLGTLSGYNLTVSRSASISGTLIVKTGITSKGSVSGSTIDGFGLGGCTGTYQKLMYNASTDKFECGSIATSSTFGTGNVLTIGDARYLRRSGGTMTGQLVVDITSGNFNTVGLKVINTLSGAHLHAEKLLTSSGRAIVELDNAASVGLIVRGAASQSASLQQWQNSAGTILASIDKSGSGYLTALGIGTTNPGAPLTVFGDTWLDSSGTTDRMLYFRNQSTVATIQSDKALRFNADGTEAMRITIAGNVGIGTTSAKAKLDVVGTISGSRLSISNNANISGALLVKNNITSLGTLSGYNLTVSRSASISGTLIVKTGITSKGSVSGSTIDGFGLGGCTGTYQKLMYNASTDKFECGTIATSSTFGTGNVLTIGDARYVNVSGDTMTGSLSVRAALSGSYLVISGNAGVSGSLLVKTSITSKGSVSGSTINGFGLGSCNGAGQKLLFNASSGKFECSVDQTAASGMSMTDGDVRYVNASGDTMTGALKITKQGGTYTGVLLNVLGSISGSRLFLSSDAAFSGSLLVRNNITARGVLSGSNLTVSRSASISGTLIVKTGITSKGSVSGSTIDGFGLGNCTGSTQKLMYNGTTDKFECGTITASTSFSTGNVLTIGDARYVKKSGDVMTGSLKITKQGGAYTGVLLNVLGSISGTKLFLSSNAAISGSLFTLGSVGIGTSNPETKLEVAGNISGTYLTATNGMHWASGTGGSFAASEIDRLGLFIENIGKTTSIDAIRLQTSYKGLGSSYSQFFIDPTNGFGFVSTGTGSYKVGIGSQSPETALEVFGTISGSSIIASKSFSGAGLVSCSNATDKLLWNATTGRFSCSTDQTAASGMSQAEGDLRYVKKSGDTMTGALRITKQGSAYTGVLLNVLGTISGHRLHISDTATISGSLSVKGGVRVTGGRNFTLMGGGPQPDGDAGDLIFLTSWGAQKGRVWTEGSTGTGLYLSSGDTTPDILIDNVGNVAMGNMVPETKLDVQGAMSGSSLTLSNLRNCDTIDTNSNGVLVCGTDQSAGTGLDQNTADERYVRKAGDTMTGALVLDTDIASTSASLTVSGGRLKVMHSGASGVIELSNGAKTNYLFTDGATGNLHVRTDSGAYHVVLQAGGSQGNVGIGTVRPGSKLAVSGSAIIGRNLASWAAADTGTTLEVVGSISGSRLIITSNANISGALLAVGNITTRGTLSGSNLTVSRSASISGTLIVKTGITSKGSVSGSTIDGFGLGSCNGASQKLLYNATTDKFECGTITAAGTFSTGNVLTIGDARYVRKSGDTMTGALIVQATMSGRHLIVSQTASFSGAVIAKNNVTVKGTLSGSRLVVSGNTNISGTLLVLNTITSKSTISGSNLFASKSLTGTHLYAAQTFGGAGLADCDTAGVSKLLWDSTTKRFSCGTDQDTDTNTTYTAGQGLTLNGTSFRLSDAFSGTSLAIYGTMSGSRLVVSGHANISGSLLVKNNITTRGTLSGYNLTVSRSASISGTLIVKTGITSKGSVSGSTIDGFGLGSCNSGTSRLLYNSTTDKFECGTISAGGSFSTGAVLKIGDARYVRKAGDTMTGALTINISNGTLNSIGLKVINTFSGAMIHAEKLLTIGGTQSGNLLTITALAASGAQKSTLFSVDQMGLSQLHGGAYFGRVGLTESQWALTTTGALWVSRDSSRLWTSVAVSSDGRYQTAVLNFGNIYTSSDYGVTWSSKGTMQAYVDVAMSADGKIQTAVESNGPIFTSHDFGVTWTSRASAESWNTISMSADGKIQTATIDGCGAGGYTSRDFGVTWPTVDGLCVASDIKDSAMSSDGKIQVMVDSSGVTQSHIISTNYGMTWQGFNDEIPRSIIAMSGDGRIQTSGSNGGALRTSYDYGNTWAVRTPARAWKSVAMSSDGRNQVAVVDSGKIYTSSDYGVTWTAQESNRAWRAVAMSSDGKAMTAVGGSTNIYTGHATSYEYGKIGIGTSAPIAMLSVDATSNAALSLNSATSDRLKPSILFGYQGNFDVAVWRSSGSVLNQSGSLIIHGGTGRTLLNLLTQASNAQTNVFKINSQVNTGLGTTKNNLVFRITASGAVYSDARYNSAGADYAEWFKTTDKDLGPGELVCVDVFQNNTVRKCTRSGDPNLMGIVSTNPSFVGNYIGGADGIIPPGYVLVGLIGQVPAKVLLESGSVIRPGDSLTSASAAGFARKAKAGESTVGVALEGYDGTGNNVVNVLISRRNQSLTVESVEQKVLDSIASMNLSDEIRQMVQSVSQNLNLDDRVTTALNSRLESIDLSEKINTAIDARLSGALLATNDINAVANAAVEIMRSDTGSMVDMTARSLIADIQSDLLAVKSAFSGGALNINSLHLAANATLEGSLTVAGTVTLTSHSLELGPISVSGSAVSIGSLLSSGSLTVMGPITVQGLAEFLGDVHIKGELRVSNRQAGFAVIPKTGTSVTVRWDPPMSALPIVTATPDVPVLFAVTKVTATGFTIRIAGTAEEKITFSFIALSADAPQTVLGYGQESPAALIPFIVNEFGQPVSSDAVWNGCIQSRPVLDSEGHPMSCARYHDGFVWEHPDLGIFFTYNPNHEPSILIVPDGYVVTPTATSSSAVSSSESSSSESSVSSSESSESSSSSSSSSSSESSVSSSESSSASSESSSSESSEPEQEPPVEPPVETPPPTESADPAPAPTE